MPSANARLADAFLAAVAAGAVPESLVTPDLTAWTLTSGEVPGEKFLAGVGALASVFDGTLAYMIDEVVEQGDKLVAEARSSGTLVNGESFANHHVFILRIQDGRVARVAEYMNPIKVQEQLLPLLQQRMSR
jgi:ketosteroid isomerase-like protein